MPRANTGAAGTPQPKDADNLLPKDKIALALSNNGVNMETATGGIDDVARGKIKKLTKYFGNLSNMYQRSLADFHDGTHSAHGHSE